MRKIIFLLLCCGLIIGMVGCSSNTAPLPSETATTSKIIITDKPTETTPPKAAVEPTEKEKEPTPTESKEQATEPTTTTTAPITTATEKTKEESKPTATETPPIKPTEEMKEEPPKEEEIYVGIQWPAVDPKDIEKLVIEKVNAYRIAQGDTAATMLPGLTGVARYRANELTLNFEHRGEQHVCTELKFGEYIDLAPYGLPEESYYHGYSREAIGMGDWFGTAESMAERIADGFHHSKGHWSYVGSSKYPYIAVGVIQANDNWYVCILMSDKIYE